MSDKITYCYECEYYRLVDTDTFPLPLCSLYLERFEDFVNGPKFYPKRCRDINKGHCEGFKKATFLRRLISKIG